MTLDYESYISGLSLPKCSFKFWYATTERVLDETSGYSPTILEEAIPGYRTNSVEGRDSLTSNINEISFNRRHGSGYRDKRHQTRDLKISYALVSNSVEHQRKQLNKLRGLLHLDYWQGDPYDDSYGKADQLYIIFNDEPDVFYKGVVSNITESKFVQNFASNGEITIHCSDPFKYSVEKHYVNAVLDEDDNTIFSINYNGTVPASPEFRIFFNGDTGYVSFIDEWEHIIQIGDPEITGNSEEQIYDEQTKGKKTEIFNNYFGSATNWRNIQSAWELNAYASTMAKYPIQAMGDFVTYGDGLYVTDPSTYNYWHGPSLKRTFDPVDNFLFESGIYLAKKKATDKAEVCIDITIFGDYGIATEEKRIARVGVWSLNDKNYNARMFIELDGKTVRSIDYTCSRDSNNKYSFRDYDNYYVPLKLERYGDRITVTVKDSTFTFRNAIPETARATGVGLHMYCMDDKFTIKTDSNHNYVYGMGIRHARMYSIPTQWKDISNKFIREDWVDIDCRSGSIKMNGGETPSIGALGNDFDEFKLRPGANEIRAIWSYWCRANPTFSLWYREVYL